MPWFAMAGFSCVAVSLRGHGGSGGRDRIDDFGIEQFAEDVRSAAEDLDEPPILVGHSMGGFVSMWFAERHPAAGLILLASVPPLGLAGLGMAMAVTDPVLATGLGGLRAGAPGAMDVSTFRRALFSDTYPDDLSSLHGQAMGPESSRAVAEMHGLLRPRTDIISDMMPVAVLGGAEDRLIRPAFVKSTARAFSVEAEIMPGLAHAMMLDTGWQQVAQRVAFHARHMAAT